MGKWEYGVNEMGAFTEKRGIGGNLPTTHPLKKRPRRKERLK